MKSTLYYLISSLLCLSIVVPGCGPGRQRLTMQQPSESEVQEAPEDAAYKQRILDLLEPQGEVVDEGAATTTEQQSSPIDKTLYLNAKDQVGQLQRKLNSRNTTVDSMKVILRELDSEINTLEYSIRQQPESQVAHAAAEREEAAAPHTPPTAFESRYRQAIAKFNAHNYQSALNDFESLLAAYPNHDMADNCQYWIGECCFARAHYDNAIAEFLKVFSYEADDKYDDAQLMIALSYYRQENYALAKRELEHFILYYPGSEYVRRAQKIQSMIP